MSTIAVRVSSASSPHEAARPSRARRVLGVIGAVVGTTVVFTAATAAGALLHLGTGPARRLAAAQVTSALASAFKGRLAIESIGAIGLDGIGGTRVRITAADGEQVIFADGVSASISLIGVARSALFGKGAIDVELSRVHIAYADVCLDADASGTLKLVAAFDPPKPTPSDPNSRGVKIAIADAKVDHGWVHGTMAGAPPLDVDLDRLDAKLLSTPKETKIGLREAQIGARGMPNGADPHGKVTFHLGMPSKTGKDMGLDGTFAGDIGGIPANARAAMDGQHLDAAVDVPRVAPDKVHALLAAAPVFEPVEAHVQVTGDLPQLHGTGNATIGGGSVDFASDVSIADGVTADATVHARTIDARSFAPTAPQTSVGADVVTKVTAEKDGSIHGVYTLDVLAGSAAGQAVPPAHVTGDLKQAHGEPMPRVTAKMQIAEPGAPTAADVDVRPDRGSVAVRFDVRSKSLRLDALPRVGAIAKGRASVHAQGELRLADQTVDARAEVFLDDVAKSGATLHHARVVASANGALTNPVVDAKVDGDGLAVQNMHFATIAATGKGHAMSPAVTARLVAADEGTPSVDARADVQIGPTTSIRDVAATLSRHDVTAATTVKRVDVGGGTTRVEEAVVDGLGDPIRASMSMTGGLVTMKVDAPKIDLARVAKLAELDEKIHCGTVSVDADLRIQRSGVEGYAKVDGADLAAYSVQGGKLHAETTLSGKRLTATLRAEVANAGFVSLDTNAIELGGSPLEAAAWRRAIGRAHVKSEIQLAEAVKYAPKDVVPLGELRGTFTFEAAIGRRNVDGLPNVTLSAKTRGLVAAGVSPPETVKSPSSIPDPAAKTDPTKPTDTTSETPKLAPGKVVPSAIAVEARPPWRLTGVDFEVDGSVRSDSGHVELASRLVDHLGALVAFDAKAELPGGKLWSHVDDAIAYVEAAPMSVRVVVPRRSLDEMPTVVGTKGLTGDVELALTATGTVREPVIDLVGRARGIDSRTTALETPVDTAVTAHYEGAGGDAHVDVSTKGRSVFGGDAHVNAKVADALDGKVDASGAIPWDASVHAKLASFPLQSISVLGDKKIRGKASGEVTLNGLHKDAKLSAELSFENLKINRAKYTGGLVRASIDEHGLRANAHLAQADGSFDATASAGATWGAALAPSLDPAAAIDAKLLAKNFRAVAILPFVDHVFAELDGKIDADASLHVDGGGQNPVMKGTVAFRDGVFQVPSLGEEFHGVGVTVKITPDGQIRADDIVAQGTTGKVAASAAAKMNGVHFMGATANIRIPKNAQLPLSIQGVEMGQLDGAVAVVVKPVGETGMNVDVDVPTLHMKLPDTTKNSVQDLAFADHIHIGVRRTPQGKITLIAMDSFALEAPPPPSTSRTTVNVKLGNDIEIRRGTDLRVTLDGNPRILISDKAHMSGQINLRNGFIAVQGKKFSVEKGTITFVDDPSNPTIIATASYDAPDGTKIYADFIGPLKTGKVTLRSEPSKTQSEILALIVFGTDDGASQHASNAGSTDASTNAAAGVGGGLATQGLNRALNDLTGLDITTKIDTSHDTPRPEVELQVSRDVSLEFVTIPLPTAESPDNVLGTFDWRVKRNWSLQTTFGDAGTTLVDAVWQYRY